MMEDIDKWNFKDSVRQFADSERKGALKGRLKRTERCASALIERRDQEAPTEEKLTSSGFA